MKLAIFIFVAAFILAAITVQFLRPDLVKKPRTAVKASAAVGTVGVDTNSIAYKIGYADGWVNCLIDYHAVQDFHDEANRLENDEDEVALEALWLRITDRASAEKKEWDSVSDKHKTNHGFSPFWSRGAGMPRRISRNQGKKLVEQLKAGDLSGISALPGVTVTTNQP